MEGLEGKKSTIGDGVFIGLQFEHFPRGEDGTVGHHLM